MRWLYESIGNINVLLMAVALGFALNWPQQRGRSLLVSCLASLLLAMVVSRATQLLARFGIIALGSSTALAAQVFAFCSGLLGHALLLAFVVVAGTAPTTNHEI